MRKWLIWMVLWGRGDGPCGAAGSEEAPPAGEGRAACFPDADGDGQGGSGRAGARGAWRWVANDLDCDDEHAEVHAFAPDPEGDFVDQDCDGCDGVCPD